MSVDEARAVADAVSGLDRSTLLAERAEAEAQLRAAEATLGISQAASNGETAPEQEPDEATQKTQDVNAPDGALTLHVEELRQAAAAARAADDELAQAASEAERPPGDDARAERAESAFARALEIQEDLPAAWRRLVGALISATGMAIVIGALGWNIYWLLVPIALIAILTVDLRLSGKAAREVSAEAADELAVVGAQALDRIRLQWPSTEEAEDRLAAARANREAAYARFAELAPGRLPSEVEEIIADQKTATAAAAAAESEAAARRAAADAGRLLAESLLPDATEAPAARPAAEPTAAEAPVIAVEPELPAVPEQTEAPAAPEISVTVPDEEPVPAAAEISVAVPDEEPVRAAAEISVADPGEEPEPEPAAAAVTTPEAPVEAPPTASQWWFGSTEAPAPPVAASAPVRALAERLSAEGREALARIEAQLAALERADHAKKSLEWHEANGSAQPAAAEAPPEGSG
ncbi:MAG TPA: hypothetical protein VFF24_10275, partial [Acidimicrobiia bacterium]|nr:hypothetical protein [Acidimicrobiia bacterium]